MTDYLINRLRRSLGISLLLLATSATAQEFSAMDRIVAIVDDDVVLASELRERTEQAMDAVQRSGQNVPVDRVQRDVLDRLILESLQLQMAERAGVRIGDSQLNEALGRIAAQNGLSLEEFANALQEQGLSFTAAREQVRREMLLQRVQQGNVNQRIQITDQEVDNFLASSEGQAITAPDYRVFHISLSTEEGVDEAEVRAFAGRLLSRLQAGEPFGEVIQARGPVEIQPGDLGWRKENEMPSLFASTVRDMGRGESAGPIRSGSGYHVVHVADIRGSGETIEQTRARHILLKPSAIRTESETEALAQRLRRRALDGERFADLAREFSEDIGSAMEGGDLGWTTPGQLVEEFQEVMDATAIDDISPPVRSSFGWHVILVENRRERDITDDLRRNLARNVMHQRKYEDELENWLRRIRDEAYVDIKLN